jgi:tetrahydromethanopterin S-methyltransferase subunit H
MPRPLVREIHCNDRKKGEVMVRFSNVQKVCEIGGVRFGGQPGEYPTVIVPSIFQKGDRVFDGVRRNEGFNKKRAEELLKITDKLSAETGIP